MRGKSVERREKSLEIKVKYPKRVNIIELENAPFRNSDDGDAWARSHGVIGLMSNVDTGGKGEVSISARSIDKMLSGSALQKSVTPMIHYAALMRLRDIIRESFIGETHPDFKKGRDSVRRPENGINPLVQIVVLYGCVSMAGIAYRAKTTLKRHVDPKAKDNQPTKAYSYEINNIEVMAGTAEPQSSPTPQTSMDTDILLNGVCDVNGVPLLSEEGRARSLEGRARREEKYV